MSIEIRPIATKDLSALKAVIEANELFPPDMLDDMMSDYLSNDESKDIWLTSIVADRPVAIEGTI